jgi:hypothetical protein
MLYEKGEMHMKKRKFRFMLSFASIALIAVTMLIGCNGNTQSNNNNDVTTLPGTVTGEAAVQDIGQGSTVFRFEVTDDEDTLMVWNVHTDATTVGAALVELGLISGEESGFGLMVTEVNGVTADWDADQGFWAFFIDGEMASAGVDSTNIEPDTVYAFVYTKG